MDDSLRETRDLALEANLNSKALIREFAEMKSNQRDQAKETRYQLNELDKKMDDLIEYHNKQQGAMWAGKKMWAGVTALSSIVGGIIGAKGISFLGLIK